MRRRVEALMILAMAGCAGAGSPKPVVPKPAIASARPAVSAAREYPATRPDSALIRSLPDVKGEILEAQCWSDKGGDHCFAAWGRNNRFGSGAPKRSELHAAVFTRTPSGYRQYWRINDFTDQLLSWVAWRPGSLKIADIDGDGAAETGFLYSIEQDGVDPYALKYLLHVGPKKYAIRGLIPMYAEDLGRYEKTPDPALRELKPELAAFADAQWEAAVAPLLKPLRDEADADADAEGK